MHSKNKALSDLVLAKWQVVQNEYDLAGLQSKFEQLSKGVAFFGGAVRDWYLNKEPRDIDIVVNSNELLAIIDGYCGGKYNSFGGNLIKIDDLKLDIWNLADTYAIKRGHFPKCWKSLVKSVPFNTDAIVVMADGTVYENGFWNFIDTKTINFVNRQHPDFKFLARRALKFAKRYGAKLSEELDELVTSNLGVFGRLDATLTLEELEKEKSKSSNSSNMPGFMSFDNFLDLL